jgi:hypothetical protein
MSCVDSTKISNGKRKGTGNVKNGYPYLAWAYMEAAQFALRFQPEAQRFYQRKLAQSPFFNVKNGCKCLILRSRSRINLWNSHRGL